MDVKIQYSKLSVYVYQITVEPLVEMKFLDIMNLA